MKTYTFHVSLPDTGRVWRKIELRADQTVEELHSAIQRTYEWDCGHLYSFFMSGKAWDESTEYRLPEGVTPWGEPVAYDDEEDWPEPTPEEREQALRALFGETDMTLEEMEAEMAAFWEEILAEEYAGPGNVQTTTPRNWTCSPGRSFCTSSITATTGVSRYAYMRSIPMRRKGDTLASSNRSVKRRSST